MCMRDLYLNSLHLTFREAVVFEVQIMVALHDNSFSEHCDYFREITSLQEEESKMKPGTNKEAIFKVLKEAGSRRIQPAADS